MTLFLHSTLFIGSIFLVLTMIFVAITQIKRPALQLDIRYQNTSTIDRKPTAPAEKLVYEVNWQYSLIIQNTSTHMAHYPKLTFAPTLPLTANLEILNYYVPIPANEYIELRGSFIEQTDHEKGVKRFIQIPERFRRMKLLLEYRNEAGIKFYTTYEIESGRNSFHFLKPRGF